jgi:hypothetical protein
MARGEWQREQMRREYLAIADFFASVGKPVQAVTMRAAKSTEKVSPRWTEKVLRHARELLIPAGILVSGFIALCVLCVVGDVVYERLPHTDEVTVVGMSNWLNGEIRPCILNGALQCGHEDPAGYFHADTATEGHTFAVEFNRRTQSRASAWKCQRTENAVSCEWHCGMDATMLSVLRGAASFEACADD